MTFETILADRHLTAPEKLGKISLTHGPNQTTAFSHIDRPELHKLLAACVNELIPRDEIHADVPLILAVVLSKATTKDSVYIPGKGYKLVSRPLRKDELLNKEHTRALSWPRQEAMWMLSRYTHHSNSRVGRFFGRDHTTVLHAVRAVNYRVMCVDGYIDHIRGLIAELQNEQHEPQWRRNLRETGSIGQLVTVLESSNP